MPKLRVICPLRASEDLLVSDGVGSASLAKDSDKMPQCSV